MSDEHVNISEAAYKISLEMRGITKGVHEVLNEVAGTNVSFALIIFGAEEDGDQGWTQYGANCERKGVRDALVELIARWDAQEEDIRLHDRASKH